MKKAIWLVPRAAIFLAGVAAGSIALSRREQKPGFDRAAMQELRATVAQLQERVAAQETASANRFDQVEAHLDEQAEKLAQVPSTAQIVSAMEQLLTRTMASLDERLSTQAQSIEVLKTTVSQTDDLLERVLESLDSLQSDTNSPQLEEGSILHRAV